jgi:hypothetical protein
MGTWLRGKDTRLETGAKATVNLRWPVLGWSALVSIVQAFAGSSYHITALTTLPR